MTLCPTSRERGDQVSLTRKNSGTENLALEAGAEAPLPYQEARAMFPRVRLLLQKLLLDNLILILYLHQCPMVPLAGSQRLLLGSKTSRA